jgi:hypothetical protein
MKRMTDSQIFSQTYFYFAICLCCIMGSSLAFTPTSELEALLNFHNAAFDTVIWNDETTAGRIWNFSSNDPTALSFNQTNPCGSDNDQTWQGVTCSQTPSFCRDNSTSECNIIDLTLESLNLTGVMTPDIDQLSMLTKLTLGDNHMEGTIPPSVGNMTNLKV